MAEDFDERMAASQRAYADIILNTAKESATRVLVAERRALQMERSLSMAKEDSLALLLRVKAIMDSKIKEAEKVNLSQVRKIQGLESQLSEAKDTIECLRSELERLGSKLDSINSNQLEDLGNQETRDDFLFKKNVFHGNKCKPIVGACSYIGSTPSSDMLNKAGNTLLPNGSSRRSVSLKDLTASEDCTVKPDLASMILRNKERELYRNGCTQRIRAFERNLLTNREAPSQSHHQHSEIERGTNISGNRNAENPSFLDSAIIDGGLIHQKKPLKSKENGRPSENCGNGQMLRFARRRLCKNRRSRRRRRITTPICFETSNGTAAQDMSDNHCSKYAEVPSRVDDGSQSGDIPHAVNDGTPESTHVSQLHKEDSEPINDGNMDLISGEVLGHSNANRITTLKIDIADRFPTSSSTGNECAEDDDKEPILVSTLHMIADEAVKDAIDSIAEEVEVEKLTAANLNIEENLDSAVTKDLGPDLESFNSNNGEHAVSDPPAAEAGSDRVVKYTFRRKRKRGCLDEREFVSSEEKNPKKKTEKEKALVEPQKHTSRDSRRLAQVARQLISLSEKRWW